MHPSFVFEPKTVLSFIIMKHNSVLQYITNKLYEYQLEVHPLLYGQSQTFDFGLKFKPTPHAIL